MKKSTYSLLCSILLFFCSALPALAQKTYTRTSANYSITTDSIGSAGENAQSADYALHGSAVGEFGVASTASITSAAYILKNGYVGQLYDLVEPTDVVSRMTHGSAGTFDIDLPFNGARGVECRSSASLGMGNYTMVFTFANNLTSVGSATVTSGAGSVSTRALGPNPNQYTVNLTGVISPNPPGGEYITVTLNTVSDSDGATGNVLSPQMGVLVGDVNGSGVVTSGDTNLCKAEALQPVTNANFRNDINASGAITTGDVNLIKQNALHQLPSPP